MKFTFAILLLLLIPACLFAASNEIITHRTLAGVADADGWYLAESTNGGFSVRLPLPFSDYTGPASDDGTQHCYVIGSRSSDGVKFAATRLPLLKPRTSVQCFLADFAQGFEKSGGLVEKRFHQFAGHESLDCSVKNNDSAAFFRLIGLSDGALLLIVEYPKTLDSSAIKKLAEVFFESAKILKDLSNQPLILPSAR